MFHPVLLGSVLGHLEATDPDNDDLFFEIRGDIARTILQLERENDNKMKIVLKKNLNREVSPGELSTI